MSERQQGKGVREAGKQPELAALAAGLGPVAKRIRDRRQVGASAVAREDDPKGFLERHLQLLGDEGSQRLRAEVKALGALLAGGDADLAAIHRGVGRVERCLEDLLEGFAEAQRADFGGEYLRGLELLLDGYRHCFAQLQHWLDELVDICADPAGAAAGRGLPSSGRVEIPLALVLATPHALKELAVWLAERRQPWAQAFAEEREINVSLRVVEDPDPPAREALGFWRGVAAMAIGFGLGGLFFGGDE